MLYKRAERKQKQKNENSDFFHPWWDDFQEQERLSSFPEDEKNTFQEENTLERRVSEGEAGQKF